MTNLRAKPALFAPMFALALSNICSAQVGPAARAISALSSRFETLVSTDSRFLLNFKADGQHEESLNALRLPFIQFSGGLLALSPDLEHDIELGYASILGGSKNFLSPQGLGMVTSRQCFVAVRAGGVIPVLDRDFSVASRDSVGGFPAWTWSVPPFEGYPRSTTFYASQLGSSYLVMANNRDDFLDVMRALASADAQSKPASALFDWKNIGGQQYWAYRSIRRAGVVDTVAAALNTLNSDLVAISFSADISKRTGFVRTLGTSVKPRVLPDSELGRFQAEGPGVWGASLSLNRDRSSLEALTKLFYSLGHGIAF